MSIKSQGGVFGRNPTFNDVTVDGDLSIAGTLSVGGETITGLSYQGGWNASTNTPDIAASSPVTGQFWIVSADGSTDVGGITNWTQGDWALYDGSAWQRVEGGNTDLSTGVQGQLAVANGGTGAADASTARTNLGLGTAATTASTDYATAAQGALADTAIQPADLGTAAYTASTDYATAAQGSLADSAVQPAAIANMLETTDIGSTVQAYDADTAKLDVAQTFTATQTYSEVVVIDHASSNAGIYNKVGGSLKGGCLSDTSRSLVFAYAGNPVIIAQGNGGTEIARFDNGGISFNGDTAAANFLDDYEEGTWTPTFGNGYTAGATSGTYTKVGRVVHVTLSITNINASSASGLFKITGLPYTPSSNSHNGNFTIQTDFVPTGSPINITPYATSLGWIGITQSYSDPTGLDEVDPANFVGGLCDINLGITYFTS